MSTKKLYVIILKKLSKNQRAVQAAHAVAQFLIENPNTEWDNGTLVFLLDDELEKFGGTFFTEPFWDNLKTAVAILAEPGSFDHLELAKF